MSRGLNWLQALAGGQALAGYPASVKVVDGELAGRAARYIAVVPDAEEPFPRARHGEVGLLEGWGLGKAVDEVIEADREKSDKRVLVAVVDVPSHLACNMCRVVDWHGHPGAPPTSAACACTSNCRPARC
ncbi:hypothetical protein SSTU70S_04520 [Stutzerimonas stutzeri]